MRGKQRLARAVLTSATRSRPAVIRNRDGCGMVVPNLLEPLSLSLWMDGVYEPETLQFLQRHIVPGSTFLDVGANIGAFTVPMAGRAQRVIAIEPSPQVLPYLRRNVALNQLSNVHIFACAASAPDRDSVPLYVPPDSHFGMASSAPQFHDQPISVPARTLDAILAECPGTPASVIKIDTEGYEAHVFLGAQQLLRGSAPPALVFEFADWAEERAFPGKKGWAQQVLMDSGYSVWTMADYLRSRPPLKRPVTEGFLSMVGMPSAGVGMPSAGIGMPRPAL